MDGSDPMNGKSVFGVASVVVAQDVVIRWPSVSNRLYDVSRATNLFDGPPGFVVLPGASNLPANPSANCHNDTVAGAGQRFYRVSVHP
jgi:hypothetical protein